MILACMDAIVLAGGYATRLRPLTYTRPKPLLPILNKAVIDWILESIIKSNPSRIFVSIRYMGDKIERHLNSKWNNTSIIIEDKPLGDAGPVSLINKLHGIDGDFTVVNGDIFTTIDINDMLKYHREKAGLATIALTPVSDPRHYGIAELDDKGKIINFIEKPTTAQRSNLANAGIYIFSEEALRYFPEPGNQGKLATDVLPRMLHESDVYGYVLHDYWFDIGTLDTYMEANFKALERFRPNDLRLIDDNVEIGEGSEIGPYTIVLKNTKIGRNVNISNSIIMDGVRVEAGAHIDGAVIGQDVSIGKWVRIERGVTIGDGTYIKDHVFINRNVKIGPFREVNQSIYNEGDILL